MAVDITRILEEAIERGARAITSAKLVDVILSLAEGFTDVKDPTFIRSVANRIVHEEIPIAAGVAAGFGKTGAFDFGIGILLEHIVEPVVDAKIKVPLEHALNLAFPNKNMSERMLVTAVEAGAASDAELLMILALQGIRPEQRRIIINLAREKRFVKLLNADLAVDAAEFRVVEVTALQDLQDIVTELKEVDHELNLIDRELARIPDPESAKILEVEAAALGKAIVDVTINTGKKRVIAAGRLQLEVARITQEVITPLVGKKSSTIGLQVIIPEAAQVTPLRQSTIGLVAAAGLSASPVPERKKLMSTIGLVRSS